MKKTVIGLLTLSICYGIDNLPANLKNLKNTLQNQGLGRVLLENSGNIGKSYRRHDEIGTPVCITIDFESLEDGTATIRDRDTMEQKRLDIESIPEYFKETIVS